MILLLLLLSLSPRVAPDSLVIMSWNVENLFDWKNSGTGDSDSEFTPAGAKHWTSRKFYSKCNGIAKTILMAGERQGRIPDAVALIEVENRYVLEQLVYGTVLRKLDYRIIHYDSPDHRGIDCALLYRKSTLRPLHSAPKHLYDSLGVIMPTRDILVAEFDSLSILVNHHPSKVGNDGGLRRKTAMDRMNFLCDSLVSCGTLRILCVGDFNDDLWHNGGKGTIKYNGAWEKIDGHFARGIKEVSEEVLDDPSLTVHDTAFGGMKPLRTFSGPRYLGGISDHYPLVITVYF